ncbi:MAG: hypothetical protein U0P81_03155 [Holophagaceae bacterium]
MACTIDHLRVDHRVTVLREFTDLAGNTLRAGDTGVLRGLGLDTARLEVWIELERDGARQTLRFALRATDGPRNGHMRDYFELGVDVTTPRVIPAFQDPAARTMIVPPPAAESARPDAGTWARAAQDPEGPDRLEGVEQEMLRAIPHLGAAASIAEMYAQRMRAFQRAGDETRAIAAFKLAVDWMGNYASSATSGGEGAALSYERDRFRDALVREFGYDPTREG